jgi:hypothetical protein
MGHRIGDGERIGGVRKWDSGYKKEKNKRDSGNRIQNRGRRKNTVRQWDSGLGEGERIC